MPNGEQFLKLVLDKSNAKGQRRDEMGIPTASKAQLFFRATHSIRREMFNEKA